jgi:heme/copper-type cytochrome/quinol oxidase subunit 4|tara:strand:+ start:216 stop:731 length:516 start_codon:yes stop_codon:yes gene_type:complete
MLELKELINLTPLLLIVNISILTNFVGETLGNKMRELFINNMILKHLIVLLVIYTSLTVLEKDKTPTDRFKQCIYIWILYLLLTKNTLRMTSILVLLMIGLYILEDYILHSQKTKNKAQEDKLKEYSNLLKYLILILLVVGHIWYIIKQQSCYGAKFNYYDLYFGYKDENI